MKEKNPWKSQKIYINEIIRINYKCNWKCKFCNVLKTNNYWEHDVSDKEVIYKILSLTRKYSKDEIKNLILSFSWWEPTLNKNLETYIKLAKNIWVWIVEIQTNWSILFKNKELINKYIEAWLDEIFLAQHSHLKEINDKLGVYYNIDDFIEWIAYIKENKINKKVNIYLNIVVWKINLATLLDYIKFLIKKGFIDFIGKTRWVYESWEEKELHKISFGLTQPNWYAQINAKEVLLRFDEPEMKILEEAIKYCENNNIFPDFHFTSPPLCILNYPDYNLEFSRLKKLEVNEKKWEVNKWNLESYKYLWKEKTKYKECKNCTYNKYCLWFYKNWVEHVWENYVKGKINTFLAKKRWNSL